MSSYKNRTGMVAGSSYDASYIHIYIPKMSITLLNISHYYDKPTMKTMLLLEDYTVTITGAGAG